MSVVDGAARVGQNAIGLTKTTLGLGRQVAEKSLNTGEQGMGMALKYSEMGSNQIIAGQQWFTQNMIDWFLNIFRWGAEMWVQGWKQMQGPAVNLVAKAQELRGTVVSGSRTVVENVGKEGEVIVQKQPDAVKKLYKFGATSAVNAVDMWGSILDAGLKLAHMVATTGIDTQLEVTQGVAVGIDQAATQARSIQGMVSATLNQFFQAFFEFCRSFSDQAFSGARAVTGGVGSTVDAALDTSAAVATNFGQAGKTLVGRLG